MNPKQARAALDETNRDLVKISTSLVESFVSNSNAVALKILFYVAKRRANPDGSLVTFNVKIDEMLEYCNISYQSLRRNLKAMQKTSIEFVEYDDNKKPLISDRIVLLPRVNQNFTMNVFEFDMYKKVLDLIVEVKGRFSFVDVKNLMEMTSKHSLRMLIILESVFGYKQSFDRSVKLQKTFDLDELNGMFGTEYKRMADFERKVLEPVRAELDDKSELSFDYDVNMGYLHGSTKGRPKALSVTIKMRQVGPRQRRLF